MFWKNLWFLCVLFLLGACSGSGSDSAAAPAPESASEPVTDATPAPETSPPSVPELPATPRLLSTSPEADTTGVALDSTLVLTFSEAVSPQSISLMSSEKNDVVNVQVTASASGEVLTLTPERQLLPNTEYRVSIAGFDDRVVFETTDYAVGDISRKLYGGATAYRVMTTGDGKWYAFFVDNDTASFTGDGKGIYMLAYDPEQGWADTYQNILSSDAQTLFGLVSIERNQQGRAMVVWVQHAVGTSEFNVMASHSTDMLNWSTAQVLDVAASNPFSPQVASTDNGDFYVSWTQSEAIAPHSERPHVYMQRFDEQNDRWESAPLLIDTPSSTSRLGAHTMAIANDQRVFVGWIERNDTNDTVLYARYFDSSHIVNTGSNFVAAALSGIQQVSSTDPMLDPNAFSPNMQALPDAGVSVVWNSSEDINDVVRGSLFAQGAWSNPVVLSTQGEGADSIIQSSGGGVLAGWVEFNASDHPSIRASSLQEGSWSSNTSLASRMASGLVINELQVDQYGEALALWTENSSTQDGLYGARYVPGSGWKDEMRFRLAGSKPQLTLDAQGKGIVLMTIEGSQYAMPFGFQFANNASDAE